MLFVIGVLLTEPRLHSGASSPGSGEAVGVMHVHTSASDGAGTVDDVFAAARAGGLDFVLLSDHNVWGAPAWIYRDSVLLIVGEEVNTSYGHLVVAGGRTVGDRRRVGSESDGDGESESDDDGDTLGSGSPPAVSPDEGLRIAAHPTGRAPWTGWEGDEFDGIEIWNADTERRGDSLIDWLRAVALLPLRPMAALYTLLDVPTEELALWDRLLEERAVFGVCAVDAHHTLPLTSSGSLDLHFPAYRHSFLMARQHVLLPEEPTGDPIRDGQALLAAVGRGSSFCAFDGLADARGARFTVTSRAESGTLGDSVAWSDDTRLEVILPETAKDGMSVEIKVLRNGTVLSRWTAPDPTTVALPGPGVYRVEVHLDRRGRVVPWILTNPIWITEASEGRP